MLIALHPLPSTLNPASLAIFSHLCYNACRSSETNLETKSKNTNQYEFPLFCAGLRKAEFFLIGNFRKNKNTCMTQQSKDHGFTKEHIAMVAVCALSLAGIGFMKNGFNFSLTNSSRNEMKPFTYEMALAEVQGTIPDGQGTTEDENRNQLAMLDSNFSEGSVLGSSTGTLDSIIPDAKDMLTPEILAPIKINLLSYTSDVSLNQYVEAVRFIELQDEADIILANLNTDDKTVLKETSKKVIPLVQDLLLVPVPKALEEYHKIKMIYYLQLSNLAEGYAGVPNAPDPKETGMQIFSVMERLSQIQSEILATYGVRL